MTIATLMATAAIFLVKGWTAPAFGALAITDRRRGVHRGIELGRYFAGFEDRISDRGDAVEAADGADDRRVRFDVGDWASR